MKLVVDENIAYGKEAFSNIGEVRLAHGREIDKALLKDADALITRSVTNVNEDLLKNTPVKFVGTATIGTDHIDVDYLNKTGIEFTSAKGCNSFAVAEYVITAISNLAYKNNFNLQDKILGIVGAGNIGSKLAKFGKALGMKVLKNDPPLKRKSSNNEFVELSEILNADIISLHVPLNLTGIDKTYHLIDDEVISKVKPGTVLINSSRGSVVDNEAMLNRLKEKNDLITVFDVWENEPSINQEFLGLVNLGTPHVAGYSLEGKVNGTKMVYDKLCEFLGIEKTWRPNLPKVEDNIFKVGDENLETALYRITNKVFPVEEDDRNFKKAASLNNAELPKYFDTLRKNYRIRREFDNYEVRCGSNELSFIFEKLRFNVRTQ